jgi:hypothetical protein
MNKFYRILAKDFIVIFLSASALIYISKFIPFFGDKRSLVIVLVISFLYYLRDITFLLRTIGNKKWKQIVKNKSKIDDCKIIVYTLGSNLVVSEESVIENSRIKNRLEPALSKFAESKEFQKKMSEVVYVELELKEPITFLKNIISNFFKVIVGRYNGHLLESSSDSLIFVIENGPLMENKLLAIACVRDFFSALEILELQLANNEVKIRCSGFIIVGDFQCEKIDSKYKFTSDVYGAIARLSKNSELESRNLILFLKDIAGVEQISYLSALKTHSIIDLGIFDYCDIEYFVTLESILNDKEYRLLKYFRREEDIVTLMNFCINSIKESKPSNIDIVLGQLRGFHLEEFITTKNIPGLYLNLLSIASENCNELIIATVVSFSKVLFSSNMNNQVIVNYFKNMAETKMPRLRANLLDSYNELTNFKDQAWNASHLNFENNRLRGNVIIGACQDEISDFYKKKIEEFFLSDDEFYIASGIFVMGHLYRLFYIKNKNYFTKEVWFKEVPKEIEKFTKHESLVVKKRAHDELSKILDLDLD